VQLGEASARALILRGAASVFAELGVRAASVDDLLAAAGVSRRTFYRLYQNKEDVAEALYRFGTEGLLSACRAAVSRETEPLRQLQGCIDAHLRNARDMGRLVFVLGGEGQRRESSLHPRRMEVHDLLVQMLHEGMPRTSKRIDPLLFRALVLALEGVTRIVLEEGDEGRQVTDASIERARRVMSRLASATLVGEGEGVAPLPTVK
jgi:AcrR family transcriptional regulator